MLLHEVMSICKKSETHDIHGNIFIFPYIKLFLKKLFVWKTKIIVEYVMSFISFWNHGCCISGCFFSIKLYFNKIDYFTLQSLYENSLQNKKLNIQKPKTMQFVAFFNSWNNYIFLSVSNLPPAFTLCVGVCEPEKHEAIYIWCRRTKKCGKCEQTFFYKVQATKRKKLFC